MCIYILYIYMYIVYVHINTLLATRHKLPEEHMKHRAESKLDVWQNTILLLFV